jgi:hypothetical protein
MYSRFLVAHAVVLLKTYPRTVDGNHWTSHDVAGSNALRSRAGPAF